MNKCECGSQTFIVIFSDATLIDCDLVETFQCTQCDTKYEAKYNLLSWEKVGPLQSSIEKET